MWSFSMKKWNDKLDCIKLSMSGLFYKIGSVYISYYSQVLKEWES